MKNQVCFVTKTINIEKLTMSLCEKIICCGLNWSIFEMTQHSVIFSSVKFLKYSNLRIACLIFSCLIAIMSLRIGSKSSLCTQSSSQSAEDCETKMKKITFNQTENYCTSEGRATEFPSMKIIFFSIFIFVVFRDGFD